MTASAGSNLHSYHHITVLLYCWHSYASRISSGLWFGTMNYFVHSLMCKRASASTNYSACA